MSMSLKKLCLRIKHLFTGHEFDETIYIEQADVGDGLTDQSNCMVRKSTYMVRKVSLKECECGRIVKEVIDSRILTEEELPVDSFTPRRATIDVILQDSLPQNERYEELNKGE